MGCCWPGPRCVYYDGKPGHYGEVRHKCKHKDRKSLNGWWERLIGCDNCVMTPYDNDDYCRLFERKEYPRPPGPPPGPKSAEWQDMPGRKS